MNYDQLDTEKINPDTVRLDEMTAAEIVEAMNRADFEAAQAVKCASGAIARAVDAAYAALNAGGRVIYLGAGTSGRLGVLDASECLPTFGVDANTVVGIIAGGDRALRHSVENAEDCPDMGRQALEDICLTGKDMVIGISASGSAPYCLGAMEYAKNTGCCVAAVVCNTGSPMAGMCDIAVEMPTGAEVLSGSTRLKAGTATKMALNMISTGAMALWGKTYKNLMVDVRASNRKLIDRCTRIVMRAADCPRGEADAWVQAAHGDLKLAIVMAVSGADEARAREALIRSGRRVRLALNALEK